MKKSNKKKSNNDTIIALTAAFVLLTNVRLHGCDLIAPVAMKWTAFIEGKMVTFAVLSALEWIVPFVVLSVAVKLLQTKAAKKVLLGAYYAVATALQKIAKLVEKLDAFCR